MDGSPLSRVSEVKPGGHALRREVVVRHQRERLLAAAVELIAERGYRAVSVADIVKRAATARAKFYENFASKEDCFLRACEAGVDAAVGAVERAVEAAPPSLAERLDAGLRALLERMEAEPHLGRACLIEAPALGAAAAELGARARASFLVLLLAGPDAAASDDAMLESVLDGLYSVLYQSLLSGEPAQIADLRPDLLQFALLPIVGPEEARDRARALA